MEALAKQIERQMHGKSWAHCAIYERDLERIWPLNGLLKNVYAKRALRCTTRRSDSRIGIWTRAIKHQKGPKFHGLFRLLRPRARKSAKAVSASVCTAADWRHESFNSKSVSD
jgi:hypothetical protein